MSQRFLIVASIFNEFISRNLVEGALAAFSSANIPCESVDVLWVPGAFELPVAAARGLKSDRYSGVICLGCVVRGETPHFDFVAGQAAAGLMKVSLDALKPVIFGVLTTDNADQALARCGIKHSNKGGEAVRTLLDTLSAFQRLDI